MNVIIKLFSAYNDKVVAFLRQPNLSEILKDRHRNFASNIPLKNKVSLIQKEGSEALDRFSNDMELILLLRLFPFINVSITQLIISLSP